MNSHPKLRHALLVGAAILLLVIMFFAWDSAASLGLLREL